MQRSKIYYAAALTLLVVVISFSFALYLFPQDKFISINIGVTELIFFYLNISAVYALSIFLWRRFAAHSGTTRTLSEAVLDTGLIAVGKYVPGKFIGLALRGSIVKEGWQISKKSVSLSVVEQFYSLGIGFIFFSFFWVFAYSDFSFGLRALVSSALFFLCFSLYPILNMIFTKFNYQTLTPSVSLHQQAILVFGYLTLWAFTTIPLIILINSSRVILLPETSQLMASFSGAIIAGWLAVFAPGGIGIREGVFTVLSPTWLTWEEGLFWIALHRGLLSLFDLLYGITSFILINLQTRYIKASD